MYSQVWHTWHASFEFTPWLIRVHTVTHSSVHRDSFSWLIPVCRMICWHATHDSTLSHLWDWTYSHVVYDIGMSYDTPYSSTYVIWHASHSWRASFVTCLIPVACLIPVTCLMTGLIWHAAFVRVYNRTCSSVQQDSMACDSWLIAVCDRTLSHRAGQMGKRRNTWTATHCNTLQHTATHCNTLQRTATHCNTLPELSTSMHISPPLHMWCYAHRCAI